MSTGNYLGKYISYKLVGRLYDPDPEYTFEHGEESGLGLKFREIVDCDYYGWKVKNNAKKKKNRIAAEANAAARRVAFEAEAQRRAAEAKHNNAAKLAFKNISLTDGASFTVKSAPGKHDGTIQLEFFGPMYKPNYNRRVGPIQNITYYYITPDKQMIQQTDSPALDKHLHIITEEMGLTLVPKAKGGKRRRLTRKLQKKRRGTYKTK